MGIISGFSRMNPEEKLMILQQNNLLDSRSAEMIRAMLPEDPSLRELIGKMTENVVASFPLPYSIVANVAINGRTRFIPLVTEESSVVAAASWSAKYWSSRGGFQTRIINDIKIGQIHFRWNGDPQHLCQLFNQARAQLTLSIKHLTANMEKRGGGVTDIELIDLSDRIPEVFQLKVSFRTADSMGANFINSCLEELSKSWIDWVDESTGRAGQLEVIMSILSNYTPDCLVECTIECPVEELTGIKGTPSPESFTERFRLAVRIAQEDPYRAVTHNKGIFNGIDGVILATANDFRAVEACGHAYASHEGNYSSLTFMGEDPGRFRYTLRVPMAVGTVGGLTATHPLAAISLKIMENPSAHELMEIAAAMGLANNFAAIKALITTGLQHGHMKMHLSNILLRLGASTEENELAIKHFENITVSFHEVSEFIYQLRDKHHS